MAGIESESRIEVTFHPRTWVDQAGDTHEWGRKQLIPADDRDPVTFMIPRDDGTDPSGRVVDGESYEANRLRNHSEAPDWVTDYDGPYFVTLDAE